MLLQHSHQVWIDPQQAQFTASTSAGGPSAFLCLPYQAQSHREDIKDVLVGRGYGKKEDQAVFTHLHTVSFMNG